MFRAWRSKSSLATSESLSFSTKVRFASRSDVISFSNEACAAAVSDLESLYFLCAKARKKKVGDQPMYLRHENEAIAIGEGGLDRAKTPPLQNRMMDQKKRKRSASQLTFHSSTSNLRLSALSFRTLSCFSARSISFSSSCSNSRLDSRNSASSDSRSSYCALYQDKASSAPVASLGGEEGGSAMADQSYELFVVVVSSLGSFFSLAEKGGVVMECCAT